MIVKDLIRRALLDIGAIASGETPTAQELNDALDTLNFMLSEWAGDGSGIYVHSLASANMVSGTGTYTVGPSGDFNVQRPEKVVGAFYRDANSNDIPVEVMLHRSEYDAIPNKTTSGPPQYLFYDATTTQGTIYLWPVPNDTQKLYLVIPAPFTKITSLTTDIATLFPLGYEAAIRWNLGFELCPEYGKSITPEQLGKCKSSKDKILNVGFARKIKPVKVNELIGVGKGTYNFFNC